MYVILPLFWMLLVVITLYFLNKRKKAATKTDLLVGGISVAAAFVFGVLYVRVMGAAAGSIPGPVIYFLDFLFLFVPPVLITVMVRRVVVN